MVCCHETPSSVYRAHSIIQLPLLPPPPPQWHTLSTLCPLSPITDHSLFQEVSLIPSSLRRGQHNFIIPADMAESSEEQSGLCDNTMGAHNGQLDPQAERCQALRKLIHYKLYKRRWYFLAVVCLLNASNAMVCMAGGGGKGKQVVSYLCGSYTGNNMGRNSQPLHCFREV